jgi:hypothetical protein
VYQQLAGVTGPRIETETSETQSPAPAAEPR